MCPCIIFKNGLDHRTERHHQGMKTSVLTLEIQSLNVPVASIACKKPAVGSGNHHETSIHILSILI
jgi:hypothetical protein